MDPHFSMPRVIRVIRVGFATPTPWGLQACGILLSSPPIVLPLDPQKPHLGPTPPRGETYSRDLPKPTRVTRVIENGGPFCNIFLVPF